MTKCDKNLYFKEAQRILYRLPWYATSMNYHGGDN